MDSFRTIVDPKKSELKISHSTPIMMLGSCFAENIGQRLKQYKFNIDLNPFGITFNPVSITQSLNRIVLAQPFSENELFQHNGAWHSFMHHGSFSNTDKTLCLSAINERVNYSSNFLKTAQYLILTFGTAWVFYEKEANCPVNNCHKVPGSKFSRRLLKVEDIVKTYTNLISELKKLNPQIKIILTVSPVRHLADGAEDNQVSKSILRLAINELCNNGLVSYFPAYEIMLDDLRDYRFYAEDMVHPSALAVDYIFTKFSETYFCKETVKLNSDITSISNAFSHKLFNPKSEHSKAFASKTLQLIASLEQKASLDFSVEKKYFFEILK
jgi:hypothetical protein